MPSSRLFEMLAEAGAQPDRGLRDFKAAAGALSDTYNGIQTYKKNKRLDTKLSDLLKDPSYGDITLRDLDKDSGLFDVMKMRDANLPVDVNSPTYDEKGNPNGLVKIGTETKRSKIVQPTSVNIYRGKEFEHKVGQDEINNLQEELKAVRAQLKDPAFEYTNPDDFARAKAKEVYLAGKLEKSGLKIEPPAGLELVPPPVKPKYTEGQTLHSPSTGKFYKVVNGVPTEVPRGASQ